MRLIVLFILSQLLVAPAAAESLSGPVKVIDAANLRVGGQLVRLHGIAAPMPGDRCALRGVTMRCGRIATTALMDLTAGASVQCQTHGKPSAEGIYLATCKANGYDLSEGMVYTGWARPAKGAPSRYRDIEAGARKRGRGLWRGDFPDAVNKAAVSR
jgi:endonuclease YncB( thermonuclease family)